MVRSVAAVVEDGGTSPELLDRFGTGRRRMVGLLDNCAGGATAIGKSSRDLGLVLLSLASVSAAGRDGVAGGRGRRPLLLSTTSGASGVTTVGALIERRAAAVPPGWFS